MRFPYGLLYFEHSSYAMTFSISSYKTAVNLNNEVSCEWFADSMAQRNFELKYRSQDIKHGRPLLGYIIICIVIKISLLNLKTQTHVLQ